MKNIAVLIAGGVGKRMNCHIPKQFMSIYDKPVIVYTLEKFENHPLIDVIEVVCLEGLENVLKAYVNEYKITKLKHIVKGGANGQESIKNGIMELQKYYNNDDLVLIHDANRANVSEKVISDAITVAKEKSNAVAIIHCKEAMLETVDGITSVKSYPRDNLKRTQTPHVFTLKDMLEAHKKAKELGITDSVATCDLMVKIGKRVYFSEGSEKNIKLTTMEDVEIFKALLKEKND